MSIISEEEKTLRDYEKQVLDEHHKTLPIWGTDRGESIYATLACYDTQPICELVTGPMLLGSEAQIGPAQLLKSLEEGFTQAMRWLLDPLNIITPKPVCNKSLISKAFELMQHASKYVDVADCHKMYGRGQVAIEADKVDKRIRFVFPKDHTPGQATQSLADGYATGINLARNTLKNTPDETKRRKLFNSLAQISYNNMHGNIDLIDPNQCFAKEISDITSHFKPNERHFFNLESDLIGFTLDEYERYMNALKTWSTVAFLIFINKTISGHNQEEYIPTQIVPQERFYNQICLITGLSFEKVKLITNRISYNDITSLPDIFQQPLIQSNNKIAWSTSCIMHTKHVRNMLKLLSRTKDFQDHAASLIGGREPQILREVGLLFAQRGRCDYKILTEVAFGSEKGDVDLLIYNRNFPEEVLLIELKAMLDADEINEVDQVTLMLKEGQTQLEKVERILRNLPTPEKQSLFKFVPWNSNITFYKIVSSPHTLPHQEFDHTIIPAISIDNLFDRMRPNHLSSPKKLWERAIKKPWLEQNAKEPLELTYRPIKIGGVTYELPAFK